MISNLLFLLIWLGQPAPVQAVCPLCTIAVGAGLGISRWLGIDDTITGVWIGGLIVSSGFWLADWLHKKQWLIPKPKSLSSLFFFLLIMPPLYALKMIGLPGNTLGGLDKILLGTLSGMSVFAISVRLDQVLRHLNHQQVFIYYQKVLLPILLLTISSLFFYLLTM